MGVGKVKYHKRCSTHMKNVKKSWKCFSSNKLYRQTWTYIDSQTMGSLLSIYLHKHCSYCPILWLMYACVRLYFHAISFFKLGSFDFILHKNLTNVSYGLKYKIITSFYNVYTVNWCIFNTSFFAMGEILTAFSV